MGINPLTFFVELLSKNILRERHFMPGEPLLKMQGVSKHFPGVLARSNISFDLFPGEVHCLIGENGAGKSTLIKILSGVYTKDTGEIFIEGRPIEIDSPRKAQNYGIATIYQEFNLIPYLTVAENIFLGHELVKGYLGRINWKQLYKKAAKVLNQAGVKISPKVKVSSLSVAQQQMVEIAKALSMGGKIIVMDEPTSALTDMEIHELFRVIRTLKNRGTGIIYISHRLEELFEIADRITVLRDGEHMATFDDVKAVSLDEIITLMVGRKLKEQIPKVKYPKGKEILKVQSLNRKGVLEDISFTLYEGEVLGFAGLVGSGRTELMRAIFGADSINSGTIYLDGRRIENHSPVDAVKNGIGLLTEDRKNQGLVLSLSIITNTTLAKLDRISNPFRINKRKELKVVDELIKDLRIKTPGSFQLIKFLSGGNQQKVVLAKWLFTQSRVLIFDEPTRGIDVGAKLEIYQLINNLVAKGVGIIIVSSELPEILGISDRIIVMRDGHIIGGLSSEEADQEIILRLAMGKGEIKGTHYV